MAVKTDPTETLRQVPLFSSLDKKELAMLYGACFCALMFLGGGELSLDALVARRRGRRGAAT